jgi:hypothetical protein
LFLERKEEKGGREKRKEEGRREVINFFSLKLFISGKEEGRGKRKEEGGRREEGKVRGRRKGRLNQIKSIN